MSKRTLDPNAQLAELGQEAAHRAWRDYGGDLDRIPTYPAGLTWAHVAFMQGALEGDRAFTPEEWRLFAHAYRNELHGLAAEHELESARAKATPIAGGAR